jgi:hypothetical protein
VNAYFVHKDIATESELAVEPELVPEGAVGEDKGRESALPSSIDVNHLPTEYVELELSYEDFIADEAQVDDIPRKGEVVERRIAKLSIPAFLRKSLERTSGQKREAVVPIQDLDDILILDASVQSEAARRDKTLIPDRIAQFESASVG